MPQDRLRKYNDENLELSKNLRQEMNAQRRAAAKPMTATVTRKRDLNTGSARGSEERTAPATAAPSRGTKRGREFEGIDKVSELFRIFVTRDFLRVVWCGGSAPRYKISRLCVPQPSHTERMDLPRCVWFTLARSLSHQKHHHQNCLLTM